LISAVRFVLPEFEEKVAKNIAKDIFDPNKTAQVITALRRASVAEENILELYMISATGSGSLGATRFGE